MSTTSFVGRRVGTSVVPVRRKPLRLPLPLLILWWLIRLAVKVLLTIARSPELLVIATIATLDFVIYQRAGGGVGASGVIIALDVWLGFVALGLCLGFQTLRSVLWSRWRYLSVYRFRWRAVMDMANLSKHRSDGTQYEPILVGVKSTPTVDRVRVRLLAGSTLDGFAKASDALRQSFSAADVRVRSVPGKPREAELWFLINDPLTEVVEPREQEVPVRLDGLPIGLREDGELYRLPLVGNHVLVVGSTGAGKSSVLWSVIYALGPSIADGTVRLVGLDPKRQELSFGESLFHRLAWAEPLDFAETLEEVCAIMRVRQAGQRGVTRLHKPTQAEPQYVVLIDEVAALGLIRDRDIRGRVETALQLLLQQGRAVGISVVGAVQDPRKETVNDRGLFTVRIALRLTEVDQVTMVLGAAARDRGARCEQIPESLQGVGFVQVDGVAEPIRVRFAYVTDEHIEGLSAGWRPPLQLVADIEDAA